MEIKTRRSGEVIALPVSEVAAFLKNIVLRTED